MSANPAAQPQEGLSQEGLPNRGNAAPPPELPPVTVPLITVNVTAAPVSAVQPSNSAAEPTPIIETGPSTSQTFPSFRFASSVPYVPDSCALCGLEVLPQFTVQLGCHHRLCFPCMIDHQAATKYNPTTNCPDWACNVPIARYQYSKTLWLGKKDRKGQKKIELVRQPAREYPPCNPAQKLVTVKEGVDDIRKFVSTATPESIGPHGVLCTSQVRVLVKDAKVRVKPVAFSALSLNPKDPPNPDVTQHFVAFHPILRAVSSTSSFDATPMSVEQLLEFIAQDQRLMFRVVLALATGHASATDFDVTNAYGQSYLLASYLAENLIQRTINPQKEIGPAIRALTAATDAEASVGLRMLLSKFRVTQSCKKYYRNKQSKEHAVNDDGPTAVL